MKPFDVTKFRKSITKAINGVGVGFNDPSLWLSTGNHALNYRLSHNFYNGVPLGKVVIFGGEPGSGKSMLCSGNIVREAQQKGIFVVLIDTENALDEAWLHALGVDTSEDKLLRLSMCMINDVAKTISTFMEDYKTLNKDDAPKVLFVIDSLGMLLTPTDVAQFSDGDLKGDMGRKAKALKALISNCVNMFGSYDVGLIATNHTYDSQSMFDPDQIISGGNGPIFAASMVVAIRKLKLKEDEDGNKTTKVQGIRAQCKIMKSRYSKPFESVEIKIPWDTGMNPYSGLVDMFDEAGILVKSGNMLKDIYTDTKMYRKAWEKNTNSALDNLMNYIMENNIQLSRMIEVPKEIKEEEITDE